MKKTTLLVLGLISLILLVPINQVSAGTYKVGSVTIDPLTSPSVNAGSSTSFTILVARTPKTTSTSGNFYATLTISGLPSGASAVFSPTVVYFGSNDYVKKSSTLTIFTTSGMSSGDYKFTVKVTRNDAPYDYKTVSGTLKIANNPPVLGSIGNKNVDEETELTFTASATDPDIPSNTLTYSLVGGPAGASIDGSTGAFSWTPSEAQGPGDFTFTVKVTDNGSPVLSDEEEITVTVNEVNTAPVLNPIGNKDVAFGSTLSFVASAADPDIPAQTLAFSLGAGAPAGASITSSGSFSWKPTIAQYPGSYTFDVVVSDGEYSDSEQITVTVSPNVVSGADVSLNENVNLKFGTVNDAGIAYALTSDTPTLGNPLLGIITPYYDIHVTANFDGTVTVSIEYDEAFVVGDENNLRLYKTDGRLRCDFNNDGVVDVKDQKLLTNAMTNNGPGGIPRYDPLYDLNIDNKLDSADLQLFKTHLGELEWIDITTYLDVNANIIFGITGDFSGFGVR